MENKARQIAGSVTSVMLGFVPFLFLFIWHGRVASSYGAGEYYKRVLPWLIICALIVLLITTWKKTAFRGKLILWIPIWLLCFGTVAQSVWTKAWVGYVEMHSSLSERISDPASRQDTNKILVAFLLALVGACALAFLNQKKRLDLQHRPKVLLLFILAAMLGAWVPVAVNFPWLYEINKVTFVIGLAILLNWPIFDRNERLGSLSAKINLLFKKIPILKLLRSEEDEASSDPLKLICCVIYVACFALPLLVRGESEFGSMIIIGITFFIMILTYLESSRKVALVSAVVLPLLGMGAFFIAHTKITKRIDLWLNFVKQGADNQQYLGMRGILLGGWFGGDRRYFSYVPEGDNDMIGSVLIQCFGGVIGALLIGLCLILVCLGFRTALKEKDHLQRGIAFGFSTTIGVQSLLMWAGNLVLLPLSGNTQPFMSSGGGSVFAMFFMVFVLFLLDRKEYARKTANWGEIK